jgi:uncharacterized phage protein (TIGR02220 family)
MNDITGFTFFKNYYEAIEELEEADKKDVLLAIVDYVFKDQEPIFTGVKKICFTLMKSNLDTSKNRSRSARRPLKNKAKTNKIKTKSKRNQNEIKMKSKQNQSPSYSYSYSYSNIINYLNKVLSTKYRSNGKKNRELIKARLNEGFTEEDFYKVIDKKHKEWKGTDFEKFLRPETLFGTKFESYLNQKEKKHWLDGLEELDDN